MADERWAPASCLLPDGKHAIIAGGYSYAKRECVAGISLYDSITNRFTRSQARLPYPADFVLAAPLPDGTILLAGGYNDVWGSLDAAALYHPGKDRVEQLDRRMRDRREMAQATPLSDGSVLISGGLSLDAGSTLRSAELYEPKLKTFAATSGEMADDRFGHAACRLSDGRVLIVGGTHWDLRRRDAKTLGSAEIYDPATGLFHRCAGSLQTARDRPTATLLPNGMVLIAGGQGAGGKPIDFDELFDPATEQFNRIGGKPLEPRMAHAAAALRTGNVLLCGGWNSVKKSTTASCAVYDWRSNKFEPEADLPFAAHDLALVVFPSGLVLAAGGKSAHGTASGANASGAILR